LSVYSIWPFFIVVAAALVLVSTSLFDFIDGPSGIEQRNAALDGIRGFLALSVMIYHAVVTHRWLETGAWIVPPAKFYDQLGPLAVAIFFMITGFLFWGKAMSRERPLEYPALYIGRVFRIAPVYVFAVASMVLIVFVRSGFAIRQPIGELLPALGAWAALGLLDTADFNQYTGAGIILAGVTWTLKWEWYFYFSLLMSGRIASYAPRMFPACLGIVSLILAHLMQMHEWYFAALFACGMLVQGFGHIDVAPPDRDGLHSLLAASLLVAIFAGWTTPWGTPQVLLAGAFFYLVCSGVSLWGLLRTRAAQRLGHISYSVYLLQGIVLTLTFAHGGVRTAALGSGLTFWWVVAASAMVLVVLSGATYTLLERPGIRVGKRVAHWFSRRTRRRACAIT
jgi:peptidoglycan/LPS O-acetylase OafA/YrhL